MSDATRDLHLRSMRDVHLRARHVAFSLAIRDRDPLAAARAAARLRIPGALMTAREFTAARSAQTSIGRALVRARLPKRPVPVPEAAAAAADVRILRAPRRVPIRLIAAAAVVAVIVFFLLLPGGGFFGGGGGGTAEPAGGDPGISTTLRGRTIGQATQAVASPTPRRTASPTPRPPGASRSPVAGGGTGTGSPAPGGGGGLGSPGATAKPALPGPDYGRLTVIVVDSISRRPIADACIALGAANCDEAARTDRDGKASQDIKLPAKQTFWDITVVRAGYAQAFKRAELIQGEEVIVTVELVPQQ